MVQRDLKKFRDFLFDSGDDISLKGLIEKEYHMYGKYIVSESVAIDLFILYMHDRDKALEKIHEYLKLDTGMPSEYFMEELLSRGYTLNEHKNEYSEYLDDEKKFILK